MRSVHSTNADRRFKVSQDFVPRKELFSVLDIMAVEAITMRLCFRSEDLKKKKKKGNYTSPQVVRAGPWASPSNLDRDARHSCVVGRRESEFHSCWLLLS